MAFRKLNQTAPHRVAVRSFKNAKRSDVLLVLVTLGHGNLSVCNSKTRDPDGTTVIQDAILSAC